MPLRWKDQLHRWLRHAAVCAAQQVLLADCEADSNEALSAAPPPRMMTIVMWWARNTLDDCGVTTCVREEDWL